jgi:hypothetical protein
LRMADLLSITKAFGETPRRTTMPRFMVAP